MGQRAQIFIRIENPLKKEGTKGSLNESELKETKVYFGNKKHSIIPFHHQWLYGITAAGMLVNIMQEVERAYGIHHPFSPDFSNFPYKKDYEKLNGYGGIELIKGLISFQRNLEIAEYGRFGIEEMTYIGDEHYDYEKKKVNKGWSNMQEHCTHGDNNDGIMIIDVPSKSYCFMNIYDQYKRKESSNSFCLPKMIPVSAEQYTEAYYPITKKNLCEYTLKENKGELKEVIKEHKERVDLIKKLTKDFRVLSLKEVKKIFPKDFKELEKEEAKKKK